MHIMSRISWRFNHRNRSLPFGHVQRLLHLQLRVADIDAVEVGNHVAISNSEMIRQPTFEHIASVAPTFGGRGCVRGMAGAAVLIAASIVNAMGMANSCAACGEKRF
jgi:hypothetical protein